MMQEIQPNELDSIMSLDPSAQASYAEKQEAIKERDIEKVYKRLLEQDDFIYFLREILMETGYNQPEDKASGDMYIRAGMKNIGISIANKIMAYAPGYLERIVSALPQKQPANIVPSIRKDTQPVVK